MMGNPGIPGQGGLDVSFKHMYFNHFSCSQKVVVDVHTEETI